MSHNTLDRLFREKAENYHPMPSPEAWQKINQQLRPNRNYMGMVMKIAATVVILLTLTVVVMQFERTDNSNNSIAGIVNHPQMTSDVPVVQIPDIPELVTKTAEKSDPKVNTENTPLEIAPIDIQSGKTQFAILDIERKALDDISLMPAPTFDLRYGGNSGSKIKIEYYADATSELPDASKGKINKLIQMARNTSPADLLADIREAKDNWINSTLNLD